MERSQQMEFVTEGWENGPTSKRELKAPAKLQKDDIGNWLFIVVSLVFIVTSEVAIAIGLFIWRLFVSAEPKSLKGRVCLVTGAGRGLGRELCLALAREGAVVACVDINVPNNKTTAEMVKDLGAKAKAYTLNIAIKQDVDRVVSQIEKELGPVFLLINNAAIVGTAYRADEEVIRASFNTNVFGSTWMMYAVLPSMKSRNEGHIVNISSVATRMVCSPLTVYGATKTSMSYISKCLRTELLLANQNNIKVTNVYPSLMNTSEDYLKMAGLKLNLFIEMEEVVKATMKGIHYNHEEVYVPAHFNYLNLLLHEFLPTNVSIKLFRLITNKINVPDTEQYKNLPWYDLIKKSSFMETQDEKTL